jgi:hypothetical protein
LKDALDQSPTFFLYGQEMTCWLCSKGGDSTDEITSTAQFNTDFNKVVTDMTANGAKG